MAQADKPAHLTTVRETVESIWIAMVLAFVLRAFVLEAFVIPTGSMAPRLMGQHWQFDCPACGYHYAFGLPSSPQSEPQPDASHQVGSGARGAPSRSGSNGGPPAVCPNCNFQHYFGSDWAYGGDRVLVLKYLYRFQAPRPWDVAVFKNPQDNEQNYIKRLIGLPGQQIEIVHGDVFFRNGKDLNNDGKIDHGDFDDPRARQELPWEILRKPDRTQEVMWQVIFENDYEPDAAWSEKSRQDTPWAYPWENPGRREAWKILRPDGKVGLRQFAFKGSAEPAALKFAGARERFLPTYAYNVNSKDRPQYDRQKDVSSDLKLAAVFVPQARDASISLHTSGGLDKKASGPPFEHHFLATLSGGEECLLKLTHGRRGLGDREVTWDDKHWGQVQLDPLALGKGYRLALTHADHQVTLWLDGKGLLKSTEAEYPADHDALAEVTKEEIPTPTVEIIAQGGPCQLWHVELMRDVFYTSPRLQDGFDNPGHGTQGNPIVLRKFPGDPDRDEFFALGDNSPASLDSRLWTSGAESLRPGYQPGTVPRYVILGKAFFVYWPGGYRLPVLGLPLVPNVGRMRLIR